MKAQSIRKFHRPRVWSLSRTKMRRRLAEAGLRGRALHKMVDAVVRLGESTSPIGITVLGCNPETLRALVGRKAYRTLTAFPVTSRLIILDEYWTYPGEGLVALMEGARSMLQTDRKILDPEQEAAAGAPKSREFWVRQWGPQGRIFNTVIVGPSEVGKSFLISDEKREDEILA